MGCMQQQAFCSLSPVLLLRGLVLQPQEDFIPLLPPVLEPSTRPPFCPAPWTLHPSAFSPAGSTKFPLADDTPLHCCICHIHCGTTPSPRAWILGQQPDEDSRESQLGGAWQQGQVAECKVARKSEMGREILQTDGLKQRQLWQGSRTLSAEGNSLDPVREEAAGWNWLFMQDRSSLILLSNDGVFPA